MLRAWHSARVSANRAGPYICKTRLLQRAPSPRAKARRILADWTGKKGEQCLANSNPSRNFRVHLRSLCIVTFPLLSYRNIEGRNSTVKVRTGGCARVLKKKTEKTALCPALPFFLLFFLTAIFAGALPQTSLSEPTAEQPTDLAKYSPFVATGRQGMVVTAGEQASEAGVEMLRRDGN